MVTPTPERADSSAADYLRRDLDDLSGHDDLGAGQASAHPPRGRDRPLTSGVHASAAALPASVSVALGS
jgi:hypothetical protein